jgi:5'-deoxynucleotidase YfbR-like HD superfamily hydrolase
VIGDLISPFKAALSLDYRAFEAKLLAAIHLRFGLPAELPDEVTKLIKRAIGSLPIMRQLVSPALPATRRAAFSASPGGLARRWSRACRI